MLESLIPRGGVIVSCQAPVDSPLRGPQHMAAMAAAAELGGAVAIRAEGRADVAAIVQATSIPVIGIRKVTHGDDSVFITPSFGDAHDLASAGAAIIALDATPRPRPGGETLDTIVDRIHRDLERPVMGDVDSVESARFALRCDVDVLATTLSGYTGHRQSDTVDIDLIADLVAISDRPVIAEGRIWTTNDLTAVLDAGAYAAVIGTAITNPWLSTQRFVDTAKNHPEA
ncbi:N-acetylmannosamine-6-phosphate 2-epimerase [Phytoactinopolyspora limicola]|uniref:N-acetylmannosamine-6-phosphate 2-epimerase n=1 Tax=Phytoactinopolyspora limicola TaxID=2715536 RepID=UPI001A9C4CD8|nr:putative N-acetylmannosamine-6-phosphate 2-epimerase [Phytoactinopolyspora limicola]